MPHRLAVFAAFQLLLASATAQDLWRAKAAPVAVGTTVKATLHLPMPTMPVGTPMHLELELTASAPWSGMMLEQWERRDEHGVFVAFVDKSPRHPWHQQTVGLLADRTTFRRTAVPESMLYHLHPGTWRVRVFLTWVDADGQTQQSLSDWSLFQVTEHAANLRAMTEPARSIISDWHWAVRGAALSEDFVLPPGVEGMFPRGTPMADMAAGLRGLRARGVSTELAVAAELIVLRREVTRVQRMAAGPDRQAAVASVQAELNKLAAECAPTATPLAGQHGAVLEVLVALLQPEDPAQVDALITPLRATKPQLANRLEAQRHQPWMNGLLLQAQTR